MMLATVEQLLAGLGSGIKFTAGVCGGDPRIAGTRIPVWTLEHYRRLGLMKPRSSAHSPHSERPTWSTPGLLSPVTSTRSTVRSKRMRRPSRWPASSLMRTFPSRPSKDCGNSATT